MPEKIIMEQPKFLYADNHPEFLQKNNLKSCDTVKDMYHQCMIDTNQKFQVCDYIYSMMFICSTLEFEESAKKK